MLRYKVTRTARKYLISSVIVLFIIVLGFTIMCFFSIRQIKDVYNHRIEELNDEMKEYKKSIFVSNKEIIAGEEIREDNIKLVTVYSNQPQSYFITSEDIGKIAIIDIKPESYILKNMLIDEPISSNLREEEFDVFTINSNINSKDLVDIRILYPNGENYIILTKKSLKNLNNNKCFLWLSEDEILNIHSAIVDAYLHKAILYTAKFIEPLQKESVTNYIPNIDVLDLIKNNPNIIDIAKKELSIQARIDLESRIKVYEENYLNEKEVEKNLDDYNAQTYTQESSQIYYEIDEEGYGGEIYE